MTIRNQHRRRWLAALLTLVSLSLNPKPRALAQILPDNTLGSEGSLVLPLNPQTEQIQGGALRGTNLFHSFRAFNIGEGRGAYFANPAAVENIFSRVTGSTPSRLFGTLGVLGEANLFFLNPNGILFGPNFSLDVRGSFVATTANSVAFPDGSLFSATDPQAPPLLTVNVTAPIGLRFEGASPGAIVNAGNLTANEGQNLTLAAGTVASSGLLAAPGGEVAVVSVPGAGTDGIPTVQLGEAGQFLDLALEPPPVSGAAAAPAGVSLPDLLAEDATPGLTVNAAGEVELAASGLAVAAGDVTVQQLSAGNATLSAAGNLTLVESQLGTTGNLQLLAKDTVRVRDSAANPFIAAAGGELLVQGDRSVDIFALNHGSSGLFSGSDMTLRSADTVNGDAHYWSGGSFQIERLDGSPGGLFSPHDPIIRSQGDIRFNSYQGTSLHILAGGQVDIGTAIITGTDTLADAINPTATPTLAHVTLSDGTPLVIDGNAQPTLDIRAGMDPAAIGVPLGTSGANFPTDFFLELFGSSLFLVPPPANNPVATRADITIGEVGINAFDGLVFLSNQYQPNLSLPGGDITITGAGVLGIGGIDARGFGGPGSAVTLDSRRDIHLTHSGITSVADVGDAGDIILIASQGIALTDTSRIDSSTIGPGKGGDINITAKSLSLSQGASIAANTFGAGIGGNLTLNAAESVYLIGTSGTNQFRSGVFAQAQGAGDAGNLTINTRQLLVRDGARVSAETFNDGAGGRLIANAADWVQLIGTSLDGQVSSTLSTQAEGKGNAGNLIINTQQLLVQDGAQVSAGTFGDGAGGRLVVNAADWVQLIGNTPDGLAPSALFTTTFGKGNAGSLTIGTRQLLIQDGARISASTRSDGAGGNLNVTAAESVQLIGTSPDGLPSSLLARANGKGDAGNLTLDTRQLLVQDGAQISAGTFGDGAGGRLSATATDWVQLIGTSPDGLIPSGLFTAAEGKGNAGSLAIDTRQLLVRDGAQVSAGTRSNGTGGSLIANAADWVQLIGTSLDGQAVSGLFTNTSGKGDAGNLIVDTRQLLVRDGAQVFTGTRSDGAGGSLVVDAADWVQLIGSNPNGRAVSGLTATTVGKGAAGSVTLGTRQLLVQDGAKVSAATFGDGAGGNLNVTAADWVQLIGTSPEGVSSVLSTATEGKGAAGNLTLSTRQLLVRDGAIVAAVTRGDGAGGSMRVDAAEWVQLIGASPEGFFSGLSTATVGKGDAGNLTVSTRQLWVQDGAAVLASTFGDGMGGSLTVDAAEWVRLIGTFPDSQLRSSLATETGGKGDAGSLTIGTRQLLVRDGALISAGTVGEGMGGTLIANATESVQLIGTSLDGQFPSGLFTQTGGKGDAGSLTIGTRQLLVRDGAQISAGTISDGAGGALSTNAVDWVELIGTSLDGQFPSGLFTQTGGKGDAGSLTIGTRQLLVRDGAQISVSTTGEGMGGTLIANTIESVQLIGTAPDGRLSGLFAATAGNGRGGSLNITTGELMIQDGAQASVSGLVSGDAGNLGVTTRSIFLDNGASIFAQTASGKGGNITLKVSDLLLLRRGSQISTTAGTAQAGGDGGNITIDAGFVVAVPGENSDIFANAFTGRGGNINITANGIFGLKFRPFLTEFSDITASSQFGVDGTVQLNTLGIDPSRGLGLLPTEPTTLQVAASCQTRGGRAAVEFFDVGSGGLPPRPDEPLHSATIIADLLPLELEADTGSVSGAEGNAAHQVVAAEPLPVWDLLSCQN